MNFAGTETEEAWRQRHRWAAERLAPLLRDLPEKPPLEPFLDIAEAASVNTHLPQPEIHGTPSQAASWAAGAVGKPVSISTHMFNTQQADLYAVSYL